MSGTQSTASIATQESAKTPAAAWHDGLEAPSIENMRRVGAPDWTSFRKQSELLAPVIFRKLRDHLGEPLGQRRVLDFGCGVGRVSLMLRRKWGAPSHACDVDASAIAYISEQLPDVDCRVTGYEPDLPFEDAYFDGLFSVSIWTHLPPDLQEAWLFEVLRIVRSGGVLLITTSGSAGIMARRARRDVGWEDVTPQDLRDAGMLYREYDGVTNKTGNYPGITRSYGLTAHDPAWIRREWGKHAEVIGVHERAVGNVQDLVVLRRR